MLKFVISLVLVFSFIQLPAQALNSVSNVTKLEGEQDNPIVGRSLVVGLVGTGDQGDADKIKAELALLRSLGTEVDERDVTSKNVAFVVVQGSLTPYMRPGQKFKVQVMSKGSAKTIKNGTLLPTLLYHPYLQKDKVFAIAYGSITVDPKSPNTGIVEATVEEAVPVTYLSVEDGHKVFYLNLMDPNFTNASTIASDINLLYSNEDTDVAANVGAENGAIAKALDATRIRVRVPKKWENNSIDFISLVQKLQLTDYVTEARVFVNTKTGAVFINGAVTLDSVAIAKGDLSIKVNIAPPGGPADIKDNSLAVVESGNTLESLAASLNMLGVKPDDLLTILQDLHRMGALHAKLVVD